MTVCSENLLRIGHAHLCGGKKNKAIFLSCFEPDSRLMSRMWREQRGRISDEKKRERF